ncbi:MAG: energy transducer TonB [Candidatus Ozemobacteraceae bacterium]
MKATSEVRKSPRFSESTAAIPPGTNQKNASQPSSRGHTSEVQTYLAMVRKEIAKQKKYPERARKKEIQGKVIVEFSISSDGLVQNPRVIKERFAELEEATLTLMNGRRFPPPPAGWDPRARIELPIQYTLR